MNIRDNTAVLARLSALALGAAIVGCGSATSSVAPSAQGLASMKAGVKAGALPQCDAVSITSNFNATKVPQGDWIWFTSVFHRNNYTGRFLMADSHITFAEGSKNYDLQTPASRVSLHTQPNLHFHFTYKKDPHGMWWLMAPEDSAGDDAMNAFAWHVPNGGTSGSEKVTWSAKFYSDTPANQIQWQWAAAAYSQLSNFPPDYDKLGVKPLDDNHYPPKNSDADGTPENDKQYVVGGATGGGGSNYTGSLSGTLAVTPCRS